LRDADRADSNSAGALYQVARQEIGVRAAAVRMQMHVDCEVAPAWVRACGGAHAANPSACSDLFRRLGGQRDLFDVVAHLDFVDHIHPFDHAAEDSVLAVKAGLRLETYIE